MKRRLQWVAWLLVLGQVAALGVGAYVYAWYDNSLEGSGRWLATKAHLGRQLMGAGQFARSHHTLSHERLDLGRWFGFQQVVTREPRDLRTVELDLRPVPGAYLACLYGPDLDGGAGLRLSTDAAFPSGRLVVDAAGELLEFEPLESLDVSADAWSHLALEFGPRGVLARLNGGPERRVGPPAGGEPLHLALRSGLRSVLVDDVDVRCAGPGSFHESFFNARAFLRGLALLAGVLLVDLVAWRAIRRWLAGRGRLRRLLVGGAASLLVAALGVLLLQFVWAGRYPRIDRRAEAAWLDAEVQAISAEIEERYGAGKGQRTRALVIGTSQTWGAGAALPEQGMVPVLEGLLRAARPEADWECIDAGVCGLRAPRLLELLRQRWLALEPDVLVLNLGNNDKDPASFEQALQGFADLASEHDLPTLFVLEANSPEFTPGELPLHPVMRAVAAEHGIPVLDAHGALKGQQSRGFLWWDSVHPTSLGHRLIAEALLPAVLALVPGAATDVAAGRPPAR